jgi:hypothetical protein
LDETRKKQIERLSERFSGLFTRHSEVVCYFRSFPVGQSFKMMKMNSSPAKSTDSALRLARGASGIGGGGARSE